MFDKRGTGLSDRVDVASLEERMDDVRAVMDAAGSERAVVFGSSEGGALAILFAVTYPERVPRSFCTARTADVVGARLPEWYPKSPTRICGSRGPLGPRLGRRPGDGALTRAEPTTPCFARRRTLGSTVRKPGRRHRHHANDP